MRMLLLIFFVFNGLVGTQAQVDRYKALFMYKFIQGMEWPAGKVSSSYKVGVLGDYAVFSQLKTMTNDRAVKGKPIEVTQYTPGTSISNFTMLYVAHSKRNLFEELQKQAVSGSTVLITETPGLAQKGSFINFKLDAGKLKFEMNRSSFGEANVRVNGALESLAIIVQ